MTAIRALGRSMVKVDMVVFTVPSGNEAMVKVFGGKPTAAVSPDEFNKLLRELKANGSVDVLSRPTLVVANRQTGFFQVGQAVPVAGCPTVCETVGLTSRVTPEVSADLKSILLAMELQHTTPRYGPLGAIDSQQTQTNVVVPDGGMMAVKVGTWKLERKVGQKVPVVGDMPYIGRLFNSIGISTEATDTVAVVTVTRVADAPCAVAPPMLPPAVVPYSTPLPQPIRTVGADGLERVGVNFNALTAPAALPTSEQRRWVVAPAGVTLTRFAPADVVVAGGVIGATLNNETAALMAAYKAACAAGRTDEATRLGLHLLAKDPTCFGK